MKLVLNSSLAHCYLIGKSAIFVWIFKNNNAFKTFYIGIPELKLNVVKNYMLSITKTINKIFHPRLINSSSQKDCVLQSTSVKT